MIFPERSRSRYWLRHWSFRYGAALAVSLAAMNLWLVWELLWNATLTVFITLVLVTARLFGFGPALFTTAVSVVFIDYVAFAPHYQWTFHQAALEKLTLFIAVSVIAASLARAKSRAEMQAEEARETMAAIVQSSGDAIYSTTMGGTITSWNNGAERLYGYQAQEAIGRHVSLIGPPERAGEVARNTRRIGRGEDIESYETERMRKDGSRVPLLLSISLLRDSKGAAIGCSVIARDISSQKRAERALRQNEKLATAGRIAATIAHEINNPLEAVTNLVYLARHDRQHSDDYLEMADQELERLATITRQTLGLVRDTPSPAKLDVAALLDEVLRLYASKLAAKNVSVEKQYQNRPEIHGFGAELRQLFSNLIVNAADAVSEGGTIALKVHRSFQWSNLQCEGVRVTIGDSGGGIPKEHLSHIFEPFFTTKRDLGTGLGLWLCQGIVQKHGGAIRVRSRTRQGYSGTVFSVFLPAYIQKADAA
jgi:PAS domain S-box-containing protein